MKHFGNVRSQISPDDTCLTGLVGLYERCDTDPVIASQAHEILSSDSHDTVIRFTDWDRVEDGYCLCFHSLLGLICTETFNISHRKSQRDLHGGCVYNSVSIPNNVLQRKPGTNDFGNIRE